MKKIYIYISVILLTFCVVGIVTFFPQNKHMNISNEITKISQDFKTNYGSRKEAAVKLVPYIKIGMTKNEVETILGKPNRINDSDGFIYWFYSLDYSQFIGILFDSEGKVVKIEASTPGLESNSSGHYKIEKNP
jgi:hypothetical protein